jgi:hypothetical protein
LIIRIWSYAASTTRGWQWPTCGTLLYASRLVWDEPPVGQRYSISRHRAVAEREREGGRRQARSAVTAVTGWPWVGTAWMGIVLLSAIFVVHVLLLSSQEQQTLVVRRLVAGPQHLCVRTRATPMGAEWDSGEFVAVVPFTTVQCPPLLAVSHSHTPSSTTATPSALRYPVYAIRAQ